MALPAIAGAALKYGPAAYGLLKGIFGGKSKEEKMREAALARIQKIAERGLDPRILQRALGILNERVGTEQSSVLARLRAGGLDPSSGLAQEAVGAVRRSRGAREGEARTLFSEQSEEAKMRANEMLAGLPVQQDDTFGDAFSALVNNLQAGGVFDRKPAPAAIPAAPAAKMPTYQQLQQQLRPKRYMPTQLSYLP